jgi:hypothetical protein
VGAQAPTAEPEVMKEEALDAACTQAHKRVRMRARLAAGPGVRLVSVGGSPSTVATAAQSATPLPAVPLHWPRRQELLASVLATRRRKALLPKLRP